MDIKKGDIVRVSKDAPKLYAKGWLHDWCNTDSIVKEVGNEDAVIAPITRANDELAIPTRYLIKVDAEVAAKPDTRKEREKQVFVIGERVRLDKYNGTCKHDGVIGTVCKITSISSNDDKDPSEWYYGIRVDGGKFPSPTSLSGFTDVLDGINVYDLIPAEDSAPTAPRIKVGARMRSKGYVGEAVVLGIDGDYIAVRRDDGIKQEREIPMTELIEQTEHTEAQKKPYEGISEETANEISDMLEAYAKALSGIADSFDWQRYEADLAKEVALKVANKYNDPEQAAEYAVSVAKAIVEGLKRK